MNKTNRSKNTGSKNRNDKTTLFDVYSTTTEGNTLGLGKYLGFVMATDITGAMNASGEKFGTKNVHCVAN